VYVCVCVCVCVCASKLKYVTDLFLENWEQWE